MRSRDFEARVYDQYWNPLATTVSWSTDGCSISGTGLFTADTAGGPYTVTATSGALTGTASVTVTAATPIADLAATPTVSPYRPVDVELDASGSVHPDLLPMTYEWDFEYDGTFTVDQTTSTASIFHTYTVGGDIVAAVRVTDGTNADLAMVQLNITDLLTPVTGLAVELTGGEAVLTWDAAPGAADGYHVYRRTDTQGFIRLTLTAVADTTYTDDTVATGVTYYYVVTWVTGGDESADSDEVTLAVSSGGGGGGGGGCVPGGTRGAPFCAVLLLLALATCIKAHQPGAEGKRV